MATVDAAQRVVSAAHAPAVGRLRRVPHAVLAAHRRGDRARRRRRTATRSTTTSSSLADAPRAREASAWSASRSRSPGRSQPAFSLAHALRARAARSCTSPSAAPRSRRCSSASRASASRRRSGRSRRRSSTRASSRCSTMVRAIERGERSRRRRPVIRGHARSRTCRVLPPPDFDGLPLDRYLAPELVLPYDPTRGCYWGVCTFCHYGLAEVGTARYRERPVETVLDHLAALRTKHGARIFYFSQDVFSPRIATNIARGIVARGLDVRWGTDMRPERSLTPERCARARGRRALSAALGVESGAPRVLSLIDKGIPVDDVRERDANLSQAGVAVEAMCFTDFPTETYREAMQTRALRARASSDDLSLFILGRFDLTHGSLVAQKPGDFGIKEVWDVEGDELGTGPLLRRAAARPSAADAAGEARGRRPRALGGLAPAPLSVGGRALHRAHDALVRTLREGRLPPARAGAEGGSRARGRAPPGALRRRADRRGERRARGGALGADGARGAPRLARDLRGARVGPPARGAGERALELPGGGRAARRRPDARHREGEATSHGSTSLPRRELDQAVTAAGFRRTLHP